jgi:hypothetical protein
VEGGRAIHPGTPNIETSQVNRIEKRNMLNPLQNGLLGQYPQTVSNAMLASQTELHSKRSSEISKRLNKR